MVPQIQKAESDEDLQKLFEEDGFSDLLLETGYRKAFTTVTLTDRQDLLQTLREYYTMIRGKVELDQYVEGLVDLNLRGLVQQYPQILKPLFMPIASVHIDKGEK